MKDNLFKILTTVLILSSIMTINASATSILDVDTDNQSGWKLYSNSVDPFELQLSGFHMGKKDTSYIYEYINQDELNALLNIEQRLINGIGMWGTHIDMEKEEWYPEEADGRIRYDYYYDPLDSYYANSYLRDIDDDGEVDFWRINVNFAYIGGILPAQQEIVFAHEIGHVYGFAHYNEMYTGVYLLMYGNGDLFNQVTDQELKAMDFLTHEHITHSWTNESSSFSTHTRRCTYCRVLKTDNHTLTTPYTSVDDYKHSAPCTVCGGTGRENHTWGTPTSFNVTYHSKACTKCGKTLYEYHNGTYSYYNSDYHMAHCSICNSDRFAAHVYDDNCDGACNVCAAPRTPPHSWGATTYSSTHPHPGTQACTGCTATRPVGNYSGSYPGCPTCPHTHTYYDVCDATCEICQAPRTPPHSTTYPVINQIHTADTCTRTDNKCSLCHTTLSQSYDYTHAYSPICAANCSDCGYPRGASHLYSNELWRNVATASVCREKYKFCVYCYTHVVVTFTDYQHYFFGNTCGKCGYVRP